MALWLAGRTHPPSAQRHDDFVALVCDIEDEALSELEEAVGGLSVSQFFPERTVQEAFRSAVIDLIHKGPSDDR
jgi:hypothetical protein